MDVINDIVGEIPGANRAIGLLANPYVAAGAAALAFGTAAVKATQYAQQWEGKMAEANVTAKLSRKELKGLSDDLLKIGGRNVGELMEVPATFNSLLSADLSVEESLKALEPSLRAAKAGFTDAATAAQAGVGVMNSSGESITKVFDVLFATVDKGAAEFADIARYLPKIIPNARAAGLALDETAGAWAFLTSQGIKSEQATTLMENAIKTLSSKDRISDFNKLGVAIFDQKGKILPLTSIIEQLSKKLDGLTDKEKIAKLGSLGLDQQAATAFNIMVQDVDKLKEAIDTTTNSAGAADQAYKDAAQSGDSWAIVGNKMLVIWEKFGEQFLPIVEKTGQWVLDTINYFEKLNEESIVFRDYLSALGEGFNYLFKIATAPLQIIWNQFNNISRLIDVVSDKLGLSGGKFEVMYLKARPGLIWIWEILKQIGDVAGKILSGDIPGMIKAFKEFKLPSLEELIDKQQKELAGKWVDRVKDVTQPGKSLTPAKTNPYSGLDLSGMGGKDKGSGKSGGGVSGGGGVKNITITIQQLLPGMTVNATQVTEAAGEIGRMIQEELVKMISDTTLVVE